MSNGSDTGPPQDPEAPAALASLARAIGARIAEEVPEYGPALRAPAARAALDRAVLAVVSAGAAGVPLGDHDRAAVEVAAGAAAEEGVPFVALTDAVDVAVHLALSRLADETAGATLPDVLPQIERLHRLQTEVVQVIERAVRERAELLSGERTKMRYILLRELLGHHRRADTEERARAVFDLTPPLALCVSVNHPGAARVPFEARVATCFAPGDVPLIGPEQWERAESEPQFAVVIFPGCSGGRLDQLPAFLAQRTRTHHLLCAYAVASEVAGLPALFVRLRKLAPLLPKLYGRMGTVVNADEVLHLRFVAAGEPEEKKAALSRIVPMLSRSNRRLAAKHLATLQAVTDYGGDLGAAAKELGLSGPREVSRRLTTIEECLGKPWHSDSVRLALWAYELEGDLLPPPGDEAWG